MKAFYTILAVVMILTGCSTTYQANKVETTGFLGDYSRLQEGKSDQSLLVYHNPDLLQLCKEHTKVMLDPVTIWVNDEYSIQDIPEEDQQKLTDFLYESVKEALSEDYEFVTYPGPDVMRIRVAITEAEGSWIVLDTLTSIHPGTVALSGLKQLAVGSGTFVSKTAIEFSIEDSISREPLIEGIDRRSGGKNWVKKFNSWGKVEASYDFWAEKLQKFLVECKAGTLEI